MYSYNKLTNVNLLCHQYEVKHDPLFCCVIKIKALVIPIDEKQICLFTHACQN